METFLQQFINGLSLGAIYALIALGYRAADADQAVRRAALALGGKASTEALIKRALS